MYNSRCTVTGAPDYGAESKNGTSEANINLVISQKLAEKLKSNNFSVILTRENENGIHDISASTIKEMKSSDMRNRVKIANNSDADIFVSIHLNKIEQEQYWGWQTFYKKGSDER